MLTPPGGRTSLTLVTAAFFEVFAPLSEALAAAPVVAAAVLLPLTVFEAGAAVFDAAAVFEAATEAVFAVLVFTGEVVSAFTVNNRLGLYRFMVSTNPLPLLLLSCLRTIRPSIPMSFNEGGHGHAAVMEVHKKIARSSRLSRNFWSMVTVW